MTAITVELNINGHTEIFRHAVTVEMEELVGLDLPEARQYIDNKIRQWIAQTADFTWTVEMSRIPARETLAA